MHPALALRRVVGRRGSAAAHGGVFALEFAFLAADLAVTLLPSAEASPLDASAGAET